MPASTPLRLLVVEDSQDDYDILLRELVRGGYKLDAKRVDDIDAIQRAIAEPWDLVVSDWMIPGLGGEHVVTIANEHDVPCIVISGTPNEEDAVTALRAGALNFLSKDRPLRFVPAVERALRESAERRARIAAERELRLSEQRYRLGFEIAPEAILEYDRDHMKIVDANPAAVKLFGYTRDELRELAVGELSPPVQGDGRRSRDAAIDTVHRAAALDTHSFEWTYRTKTGELVPTETHHARLPWTGANIARATIIDLRPRLRIEAMRVRAIELELQNRRIQEANRLKSEFLANMSHELRTPLNAIIGFAELMYDGHVEQGSPQHEEFLGDILTSGRHLLQLINDVLDLAKVEAGKLDFRPETIELAKILGEVVAITRAGAAAKRIALSVDIDPEVARVVIDPNRLKQTAYNYVSNAVKFTPEGGRVTIRARLEDERLFRLEVEDTGIGIAEEDIANLFVEFHQLEAGAAKRHQGTGLGLALTRRLVEAQGGAVGVKSVAGKGSVFHALLPRRATPRDSPVVAMTTQARHGARRVLVVEDDMLDRELLVDVLAGAGYAVDVARDGREAIERCRERTFDAITLDLILPDTSGFELLAQLRFEPRVKDTPVVVVSVVPERRLVAGFAVADVLRKPLDREALLAALERAGVRPDRPEGVLVVDDDDAALRLMEAALAQLGYTSITRSSAATGLDAARDLRPSAVVLDLVMPVMDGVQFLDHFRRMQGHARTPVLIWTGKDLDMAEHARLRESAQAVVAKNGNSPSTVVTQLRAMLAAPERS